MKRWFAAVLIAVIGIVLASPHITGNPIPVPVGDPEKEPEFAGTVLMDLEDIQARIYSYGEDLVASVEGVYRFGESYPTYATAARMMYPIPINSSSIDVRLGGRSIDWVYSNRTFETVMGDYPVIEWNLSLPESRPFNLTVNYQHPIPFDQTDETYTLLYAMGSIRLTGYSEPTVSYSKDADVFFKVFFPSPPRNLSAMLVTPETSTRKPISHDVVEVDGEFAVTTNLVLDLSIWRMDYALRFSSGEEGYPPLPRFNYSRVGYPKLTYETIKDYSPHLHNYTVRFDTDEMWYQVGPAITNLKVNLEEAVQLAMEYGNLGESEYDLVGAGFSPGVVTNGTLTWHPIWYLYFARVYGGFWAWDVLRHHCSIEVWVDALDSSILSFHREDSIPSPKGEPRLVVGSWEALKVVEEGFPQFVGEGEIQLLEPRIVYMGPDSGYYPTQHPLLETAINKSRLYWVIEIYSNKTWYSGENAIFFVDAETGMLAAKDLQRNLPHTQFPWMSLKVNYASTLGLSVLDDQAIMMDADVIEPGMKGSIPVLTNKVVMIHPGKKGSLNLSIGWEINIDRQTAQLDFSLFNPAPDGQRMDEAGQPQGITLQFADKKVSVPSEGRVNVPLKISANDDAPPATYLMGVRGEYGSNGRISVVFLLTVWDGEGDWPQPKFLVASTPPTPTPTPTPIQTPTPTSTPTLQPRKGLSMESIGLVIAAALVVIVAYLYFTRLKKV